MNKQILQSFTILCVNFLVGFLTMISLMLFLGKDDPILAAIPAILALPGILVQPWFILFLLFSSGVLLLLTPVFTTVVTVLVYAFLDRKGKLDRIKLVLARIKNRRTIVIIGITIVCLFTIGIARYVDFPVLHWGIPDTLKYSLKDIHLTLSNPRYYCLGNFIDSEWLWQVSLSERDLDLLADKLGIQPIPLETIGSAYWNMPPFWWRPVKSEKVRVLSTVNFPMGSRGSNEWHALATWNPENEVLHMWMKDNF